MLHLAHAGLFFALMAPGIISKAMRQTPILWRSIKCLIDTRKTNSIITNVSCPLSLLFVYFYLNTWAAGIGTYIKGQGNSATRGKTLAKMKSGIITTVDQAVGTSFQQHVLAGYHFVMRYYQPGDHLYIFGFSRGAYTARFLAEMIHDLGLLSKGNEEMVQFAWDTFSDFQQSRGNDPQTEKDAKLKDYMLNFNKTFCRPNVGIHFLGLFDCVNSVGQFEIPLFRKSYKVIANPPARYIRHAVAIHERRLKFKPALFHIDPDGPPVDLKEVWFAGNHCDIGGGYGLEKGQNHLLSDTALNWMLQEVLNLEGSESKLQFQTLNVDDVSKAENAFPGKEEPGTDAFSLRRKTNQPHDTLKFGHGTAFIMVLLWWILGMFSIFVLFFFLFAIGSRQLTKYHRQKSCQSLPALN